MWGLPGPAVVAEGPVLCRRIHGLTAGLRPGDARGAQAEALKGGEAEQGRAHSAA